MADTKIQKTVHIHLLRPDANGPIKSRGLERAPDVHGNVTHEIHRRFSVCCDPEAGLPNHSKSGVSYTGEPGITTCPECKKTEYYLDLMRQRDEHRSAAPSGLPRAKKEDFPVAENPEDSEILVSESSPELPEENNQNETE